MGSRITSYIITAIAAIVTFISCIHDVDDMNSATSAEGTILLNFRSGSTPTRHIVDDTALEARLTHLDVVIYKHSNGTFEPFHHERIDVSATPSGDVPLSRTRKDFEENTTYRIYVIANSTESVSTFKDNYGVIISHDNLLELEQEDANIHFTGIHSGDGDYVSIPQSFLMDGAAYLGASEPDMPEDIVINPGDVNETLILNVTLRRAAAKFVVRFYPGENVILSQDLIAQSHGYMVRNLPFRTTVLGTGNNYPAIGDGSDPYWKSSTLSLSPYFSLKEDSSGNYLEVVLYTYSHKWNTSEFFSKGTSLVIMLPIKYKDGETVTEYINNYYQLVLNKKEGSGSETFHRIKRNTYYDLRVHLNAPGAQEYTKPEEIKDILYFTAPWEEKEVEVNGENQIAYLKVNKEQLFMYNIDDDDTSLHFSSSSPVSITIDGAYYYNKFNNKINITGSDLSKISVSTAADAASGNIHVHSDIPTNYTIRYFRLKITNQEGLTEYVDVEQYPLIYITNNLPWYSYRDDYYYRTNEGHSFASNLDKLQAEGDAPTTLRYDGDHIVSVYNINSVNVGTKKVTYTYTNNTPVTGYGFTVSKYRGDKVNNSENYRIMYYHYDYTAASWWNQEKWTQDLNTECEKHNVRNYHVRMMASSGDYTLGRPRLDAHGYTADDSENAKLVSPSFVIASRLGAVLSSYSGLSGMSNDKKLVVFADHCKNYVEVDDLNDDKKDPVEVHDNWRLPTKAELDIIIQIQGKSGENADAIDYLLNGGYYMSASGPVYNSKNNSNEVEVADPMKATDVAIRCVRDAF